MTFGFVPITSASQHSAVNPIATALSVSHMIKQFYYILRLRSFFVGGRNFVDLTVNRRYRNAIMCKGWW
jgi:hypothetical protein